MLESAIEKRMTRRVKDKGGLCLKWAASGTAGVPDRIILLPGGRVIFAELKQAGMDLRELQKYRREQLENLGFEVWALRGTDELEAFFREVLDGV